MQLVRDIIDAKVEKWSIPPKELSLAFRVSYPQPGLKKNLGWHVILFSYIIYTRAFPCVNVFICNNNNKHLACKKQHIEGLYNIFINRIYGLKFGKNYNIFMTEQVINVLCYKNSRFFLLIII